jgi:ribosomal protein S27AE
MKNELDRRIDEALAESPCEDESVAEDENWWMDYAYIFADQIEEQYGHADRDQFLEFTHKIVEETKKRALDRPMGVSEWREHGKKYRYWEFFEKLDQFDPKHPRCPKCGTLMAEMEPHIWMCACSPKTRLSIG